MKKGQCDGVKEHAVRLETARAETGKGPLAGVQVRMHTGVLQVYAELAYALQTYESI